MLYRPPLDLKWKVTGGRWVCDAKEYVYPDNDWAQFAPDLEIIEVPGDHNSIVLEPNVRVLASHMAKSIAAAERELAPESVKIIAPSRSGRRSRDMASILTVILNWRTPEMTLRSAQAALREMAGLDGALVIVQTITRVMGLSNDACGARMGRRSG